MQNFGKIKNVFNELLVEGLTTKNGENVKLFKKYLNTIKENEILKTQFLVNSNIENKIETDREKAFQFVNENINLLSKFSKKEINEANKSLMSLCSDFNDVDYDLKGLHENISTLIMTKKTTSTIDIIVESTSFIVDFILNNKPKVISECIDLPNSMLSSIMVDKYNEKYSTLNESEKSILKVLIDSDDNAKKDVYTKMVRECIDLINETYPNADLDSKDRLLRVKDKLLNDKVEINEDYFKNVSKLVELKESLTNK